MPSPFDQSRYQVRVEWGTAGLTRLAPAEIVVLVDVLLDSTSVADAVARGDRAPVPPSLAEAVAAAGDALVYAAGLTNATAVAREVLAEQQRRADRTSVAVIALGDADDRGGLRVAVEDQFGVGAVVDALGTLGIDHTSPEAAAAGESFRGLRRALRHLLTASGAGQALLDAGRRDEVLAAARIDAVDVVPVLRDGVFVTA
ncbi:MAG: 2-phosphosulfolactate phosphatase [Microbacterium sp.]|uniref:2-phosphosulfolactate phosphatase n=1 Tax=Microbacterium sp. TaxID=51671 RepID=UPI002628E5C8|nr:2-phosphosulfolactate phosphatase [Microbacterium sp.]MCX6500859.1 2-phosphosulfolactate phosphatase [Microbacterium sp.]